MPAPAGGAGPGAEPPRDPTLPVQVAVRYRFMLVAVRRGSQEHREPPQHALGASVPVCCGDAHLPQRLPVWVCAGWRRLFVSFGETLPLPGGQPRSARCMLMLVRLRGFWLL